MQPKAIAGLLDMAHPGKGEVRRKDEFMCRGEPLQLMTSLPCALRFVGVELDRPIGLPQRDDRAVHRVADIPQVLPLRGDFVDDVSGSVTIKGQGRDPRNNRPAGLKRLNLRPNSRGNQSGIRLALHERPFVRRHSDGGLAKDGSAIRVNEATNVIGMGVRDQDVCDVGG